MTSRRKLFKRFILGTIIDFLINPEITNVNTEPDDGEQSYTLTVAAD